ncbi:aromatic prenyltransferase [Aspergillus pseudotamarii]|uniref:Aromatic prenyltransferase n=1 Tax=Aspergillus pseudotamarii TaxID=132259 RepID=A0A5N6SNF0_ASPPS|nr:aromatic prenyltransferase [Aspergillus pseudotamarii]KAE8135290.1 aromatic prenyltransferase [Aspergillus pseudotamarii]
MAAPQRAIDYKKYMERLQSWDIASMWLGERQDDIQDWWDFCGPQLVTLAHEAGYSPVAQIEILLFFRSVILPNIGRFPHTCRPIACAQARSILTYDGSPIEYSWRWNVSASDHPQIRFCVEPAGHSSCATGAVGSKLRATDAILAQLAKRLPHLDREWYYYFLDSLHIGRWIDSSHHDDAHPWQGRVPRVPVAFDFTPKGISTKVYFTPPATPNNMTSFNTIADSVRPICQQDTAALDECMAYFASDPVGATLRPDVVAIDCVSPLKSRIKVYAGTPMTAFTSVVSVITLGGRIPIPQSSIDEMWALFRMVLALDDNFSRDEELPVQSPFQPSRAHREDYYSGLLYYFNLASGSELPDVKLDIPVIRYGRSDEDIAHGLQQFMISRGRGQYVDGFQRVMEIINQRHQPGNGHRVQTYISCSIEKDGSLSLTSYLNPGVYSSSEAAEV